VKFVNYSFKKSTFNDRRFNENSGFKTALSGSQSISPVLPEVIECRHTLAFRLTLWYAIVFTVSSCAAFLFFYLLITSVIRDRTDQDLAEQVGRFSTLLAVRGIDGAKQVAVLEAQAAGEKKIFIRFLHRSGIVFSSSNMSYWQNIPVDRSAVQRLLDGERPVLETITIAGRKHSVRVLYDFVSPSIILQLGQAQEPYTRFIEAFQRIFIGTMAFLIIFAALIGWFMARRALSGVAAVTRTARNISEGALEKRVPVKPRGDEIDQLAVTFNRMLDRIEILVAGIKEMSDNIAHDLKSPITRIRGLAEVTLTTDPSIEAYETMAAGTIEECDRLLDMINTMLLISRTEAGAGSLAMERLDLAAVIRNALELFQAVAEDKKVALDVDVTERCTMLGDISMLQRLVANLLDNAIKFTSAAGRVSLRLVCSGETATLILSDSGVGISPEDLPHIFKRFYRCDQSRSQSGTGLGLSLARTIARAHGGRIDVASSRGAGSTFTVTLPVVDHPEIEAAGSQT